MSNLNPERRGLVLRVLVVSLGVAFILLGLVSWYAYDKQQETVDLGKQLASQVADQCNDPKTPPVDPTLCKNAEKIQSDTNNDPIKLQGRPGHDGKNGLNGRDGKNGKNGKNGVDGVDGKDGLNGKDGRDGVDGQDGAPGGPPGKDGVDGKDGADGKDGQSIVAGSYACPAANSFTFIQSITVNADGTLSLNCASIVPLVPGLVP